MWAVVYAVVIDWLLIALAVASTCTYLANKYLRQRHSHSVEQEVEWMYAFDVHINSYMCSFMLTHVLQVGEEVDSLTPSTNVQLPRSYNSLMTAIIFLYYLLNIV